MQPIGVLETAKATNPLKELLKFGQSVWLDYIRRDLLTSGELKRLIDEDGLRGMTSNPTIFEKAIADSTFYDDLLKSLRSRTDLDAKGRYEILAIRDIQDAADLLRPVYDSTKRRDGYVSLEVSPYLARDTKGTLEEARRLWKAVGRENVMIKVPGTTEGIPAFQQVISEGININVTLLFAQEVYVKVAEAYIAGLEQFAAGGGDVSRMASVASFFISRIDSAVDAIIDARLKASKDAREQEQLKSIQGKVAIANGKQTYQKLPGHLRHRSLEETGRQGCADPARALGQHQHQEPGLPRCAVRRRTDRAGHGEHHSAGDARRLPRSWEAAPKPDRRSAGGPQDHGNRGQARHLDERGYRQADR